ncbi:hypothetical protein [Aeromonas veronii]|uniref:hypothetical protein n=1 Tax=Aeromonas veronii TaxID=654 RepID=UPI003DA4884A
MKINEPSLSNDFLSSDRKEKREKRKEKREKRKEKREKRKEKREKRKEKREKRNIVSIKYGYIRPCWAEIKNALLQSMIVSPMQTLLCCYSSLMN